MAALLAESTQALVNAIEPLVPRADGSPGTCPLSKAVIETAREKLAESMVAELPLFAAVTDPRKLQPHPDEDLASGLALLLLLAQAYYKILECAVSPANWATRLDPQLNHHYFWTINNLTNLLKNHEQLKDFPTKFEPAFPDLNPSTIRDVEWEDMVAPGAEQFLGTVQKYVLSKPVIELREGSGGWIMVEVFKDSISKAVDYAIAYNVRLRQDIKKMLGANLPASSPRAKDSSPTSGSSDTTPMVDPYAWARQAELIKAVNKVIGEGELNPGVLSRACKAGEMTTNQQTGRGAMVAVKSFIAWLGKKRELPKEELDQVRNAIIGEISARK